MPIDHVRDVRMIKGNSMGMGIDGLCLFWDDLMSVLGWLTNVQKQT